MRKRFSPRSRRFVAAKAAEVIRDPGKPAVQCVAAPFWLWGQTCI